MKGKYLFLKDILSFFAVLGIVFIPFSFSVTIVQLSSTDFIFGKLIRFVSAHLFGIELKNTKVYSDSVSMYVLVLLLLIVAVVIGIAVARIKSWRKYRSNILSACYTIACYYLILQLLKYGFGKIFKDQFYLPEPNTLFTPVGNIDKDLLYWTSMGTSRVYNFFAGGVEVLAALLLLFRRTRMAGSLLAFAALLQVAVINFSFDISVKLFSLFLLLLTVYLLAPYCQRLYYSFFSNKSVPAAEPATVIIKHPFTYTSIKCFIIGLILVEVFLPYIRKNNFNDDTAKRPYLHGAYEVKQMITGTDTITGDAALVKRFFIHRNDYMIFQNRADEMQDYKLSYDADRYEYILTDYQQRKTGITLHYSDADSILQLKYTKGGKPCQLTGKAIDWKKLPLLRKSFHWTSDGDE